MILFDLPSSVGPRAGQKLFTLQTVAPRLPGLEGDPNDAARAGGFSLRGWRTFPVKTVVLRETLAQIQRLTRSQFLQDDPPRVLVHPGPRVDSRRVLPEVLNDQADCP